MLRKGCPISYAKFQRHQPSGSAAIPEKLMGGLHRPPCPGRVNPALTQQYSFLLTFKDLEFVLVHQVHHMTFPMRICHGAVILLDRQ